MRRVGVGLEVPPDVLVGVVLVGVVAGVVELVLAGCVVVVPVSVLCTGGALATETVFAVPGCRIRPAVPRRPGRSAALGRLENLVS